MSELTKFPGAFTAPIQSENCPIYVLGHKNPDTDSIVGAIAAANLYKGRGYDVKPVAQGKPAPETAFVLEKFNLDAPEVISSVAGKDFFLVDYADLKQAPEDFKEGKLLGIVDHHKLGDVSSDSPLECWIWPVGSSNTILKVMHDFYGVELPKNIAGAMLCAILSDTLIFNSPTATPLDKKVVEELAKIAEVEDIEALGMEMFKAKSNLNDTPKALLNRDFKDFEMGEKKIGIGQLELIAEDMGTPELKAKLIEEMDKAKEEGRDDVVLVITDILKKGSRLMVVGPDAASIAETLGADADMWMDGVLSRKKQIVPPLQKKFA